MIISTVEGSMSSGVGVGAGVSVVELPSPVLGLSLSLRAVKEKAITMHSNEISKGVKIFFMGSLQSLKIFTIIASSFTVYNIFL